MRPTASLPTRPALPTLLALVLAAAGTLTACGGGSGSDPDTIKVSFKQSTDNSIKVMDTYLADIKEQFEKANPGKKVEFVPIKAPDSEYYTKLQQMLRSPKTAPDLVYEDTFLINSDITSGYLKPLDPYLAKWKDWGQFIDAAKSAAKGEDGKTYGVPDGTDTRGLWFSKDIFKKAGLPADWQPKTWDEVLDAARTIKKKVPDAIPLNVYTGKPVGEAATMQTLRDAALRHGCGRRHVGPPLRQVRQEVDRRQPGLQGLPLLRRDRLQGQARPGRLRRPRPQRHDPRPRRVAPAGQARHRPGRLLAPPGLAPWQRPRVAASGPTNSASPPCRPRTARPPAR